jgi:Restriction endonuclease FokI, C terminal
MNPFKMITSDIKTKILSIWDKYIVDNKVVLDVKGNELQNLDDQRTSVIPNVKSIVNDFIAGKINTGEFKTAVDSFNKQNNFWGFTSVKGQMFFNLLTKTNDSEDQLNRLTTLLRAAISEPKDVTEALQRIEELESFCTSIFSKAKDKRRAPNPNSVGYFLSYFWQIHNNRKWPVMYSSMIVSLTDIGLWESKRNQKDAYLTFYNLNEEIKKLLSIHTSKAISNWDAEHAFWNFRKVTAYPKTEKTKSDSEVVQQTNEVQSVFKPNFDISEYIIPKVARLIELGSQSDKSGSAKGSEFERLVCEIFKQLDFEVEVLGQGSGRNPDAIIKCREENTAFLVDAKAYVNGYSLGIDDRAMKEYINHHCPKLQKDGYKKIGFIIVSNSFKSNFDHFVNDVTWNTDIKRFVLLTSEALLYLLAYKTKDKLSLSSIIESIVSFGTVVSVQNVIEEFDDV